MGTILNINNDKLLSEDTTNSLIDLNKVNKIFIDKDKKYLNLYASLIKKSDFHVNTKNSFLKRTPYLIGNKHTVLTYLERLPDEYRLQQYKRLRQIIANYYLSSRLDFQIFNKWFKHNRFPLVFYRVLSNILKDNKILIRALSKNYITDVSAFRKVKLPFLTKELFSQFNFYLAGIVMGDGNISEERLKIVDGDKKIENLHYSKKFLSNIRGKIKMIYHLNPSKPYRIKKKAYELIVANKWFCRYLNFFFSIQLGRKKTLLIPKICNLLSNKHKFKEYVIRGIFDTDGSITGYRAIMLSIFPELIEDLRDYFNAVGIKIITRNIKDKKKRARFRLDV